jgi:hypothetical protein
MEAAAQRDSHSRHCMEDEAKSPMKKKNYNNAQTSTQYVATRAIVLHVRNLGSQDSRITFFEFTSLQPLLLFPVARACFVLNVPYTHRWRPFPFLSS